MVEVVEIEGILPRGSAYGKEGGENEDRPAGKCRFVP